MGAATSKQPDKTFIFTGDTEVGTRLSALLTDQGFKAASGLDDADVVFTYHETQSGLEDMYFGSPGLISDTKPGVVLVDLSPTTPSFAQELSALSQVNDRVSLDAPLVIRDITNRDAFASARNLMIVAGGSSEVFNDVLPLLNALASRVVLMGKSGAGQAAKVAITLHNAAAVVGLVEADAFRVSSGDLFDGEELLDEAVEANYISPVHAAFFDALKNQSYEGTYTIEIMMVELLAALGAADDKDLVFPHAEAAFHLMELLAVVGGSSLAPAALSLLFADEEAARRFGLDWDRAEEIYGHPHDAHDEDSFDEDDHGAGSGCSCGHHGNHGEEGHECCGKHNHHHG